MSYTRVNWENLPSTNTPVNATNLNKMDAGIANAVEKTGDTMTGELLFENKNLYNAIRKTRTLNNEDYQVSIGVGANGCARMEYVKVPNNVLSSIEARSDGLYNGVSEKRLAEQSTGWSTATLSSKLSGTIRYTKIGNIVVVNFSDVEITGSISSHGEVLASGLPNSSIYITSALPNYGTPGQPIRIAFTTDGKIQTHYSNTFSNISTGFYGTLAYITNQ